MQVIPLLETMNISLAPFTRSPPSQLLEILDVVKIIYRQGGLISNQVRVGKEG